jgi:hypothetical protein
MEYLLTATECHSYINKKVNISYIGFVPDNSVVKKRVR